MSLFLQKVVEDGYTSYSITNAGYFLVVVLAIAAFAIVSYFMNADGKFKMSVKQLTFSALCLALAFGALGVSGFFHNKSHGMIKGYLAGIFGRFLFSTLSGVIFFADYAPEGMNPLVYSMTYNGSYIAAEGALTVAVLLVPAVHSALNRIKVEANEKSLKKEVSLG